MAEEETHQERTEQATSKRRQDFREKGQVAQSKEVHTAALLTTSLLLWFFYGPTFWVELSSLIAGFWRNCGEFQLTELSIHMLTGYVLQKMAVLLAPMLLLVLVVGFFSSFLQIGWLFTSKPLTPDLSKLDPIKGAAKFISKRSAVEFIKSLLKVLLVGMIAYKTVAAEFSGALILVDMELYETIRYISMVATKVMVKCCGILIVLGLFDYAFVRWEMEQKMKMTKQEVKEEAKTTEGDPQVKGRIRSLQMQMARKRMMAEVPKADVVITNPTRLAVALKYKAAQMAAPLVVAMGAGAIAHRIKEVAAEHRVPIIEDKPLARALYKTANINEPIPENLFQAVAEVLAYVYGLRRKVS